MTNIDIDKIFGWSAKSWSRPFLCAMSDIQLPESCDILEVGAGRYSSVALLFLNGKNKLHITSYPEAQIPELRQYVEESCGNVAGSIKVSCMSAKDIGEYDLIVMKSVLGGIFRVDSSGKEDAEDLLCKIAEKNLKPRGTLVTLDNGATVLEPLLSRFGARANKWRFFVPSDFKKCERQYGFGLFSSFSVVTRFGVLGSQIEKSLYLLDAAIYSVVKVSKPSVIVTVYKRQKEA